MGVGYSNLHIKISSKNDKYNRKYTLNDENYHNEKVYYTFNTKKRSKFNTKKYFFIKAELFYKDKMLDCFSISLNNHESYSTVDGNIIYKYISNNNKGQSKIIINICKDRIENVTYQKDDTLQFKIDGIVI